LVIVTPDGKLTPVHVAVELATVPDSAPHVILVSDAFSDVRYKVTVLVIGTFCAAIDTDTGTAEVIVTSGTIGLAVGYCGAFTPFTLVTCTAGVPEGSGGL
jgi:hypothetical protein